jgi:hypothetical protein
LIINTPSMSIWNSKCRILWMNANCYAKFPLVIQPIIIFVKIDLTMHLF